MITLRFLTLALLLCLLSPYYAYNQNENKGKKRAVKKEQNDQNQLTENKRLEVFQFFENGNSGAVEKVDRAVLEIKFNEWVDEMDYLYHTPPEFKVYTDTYFGYKPNAKKRQKGN